MYKRLISILVAAFAIAQAAVCAEPVTIFSVDSLGRIIKVPLPRSLSPEAEEVTVDTITEVVEEAAVPSSETSVVSHPYGFTWGGAIGTAIDMSSHDMSTIKASVVLGYKSPSFPLVGVGAGVNMMMSNSNSSFPIFAVVRTNFGATHSPLFIEMRAGAIVTNLSNSSHTALYLSPGIGINLAKGEKFRSYLLLSYEYNGLKYTSADDPTIGRIRGLDYASASIGILF